VNAVMNFEVRSEFDYETKEFLKFPDCDILKHLFAVVMLWFLPGLRILREKTHFSLHLLSVQ
jgi:hypothetical protein